MGNTLVVVVSHGLRSEAFKFGAPPLIVAAWNMVFNLHTQEVAVIALDDPAVFRRNILVAFLYQPEDPIDVQSFNWERGVFVTSLDCKRRPVRNGLGISIVSPTRADGFWMSLGERATIGIEGLDMRLEFTIAGCNMPAGGFLSQRKPAAGLAAGRNSATGPTPAKSRQLRIGLNSSHLCCASLVASEASPDGCVSSGRSRTQPLHGRDDSDLLAARATRIPAPHGQDNIFLIHCPAPDASGVASIPTAGGAAGHTGNAVNPSGEGQMQGTDNDGEEDSHGEEGAAAEDDSLGEETTSEGDAAGEEDAPDEDDASSREDASSRDDAPDEEDTPGKENAPSEEDTPSEEDVPEEEGAPSQEDDLGEEDAPGDVDSDFIKEDHAGGVHAHGEEDALCDEDAPFEVDPDYIVEGPASGGDVDVMEDAPGEDEDSPGEDENAPGKKNADGEEDADGAEYADDMDDTDSGEEADDEEDPDYMDEDSGDSNDDAPGNDVDSGSGEHSGDDIDMDSDYIDEDPDDSDDDAPSDGHSDTMLMGKSSAKCSV